MTPRLQTFQWHYDPPYSFALDAIVRGVIVANLLVVPVSLVALWIGVRRRRKPVTAGFHRLSGGAVFAHGASSALLAVLFLPELIVEASATPWTMLLLLAVLAPSLLGIVAWWLNFRRPVAIVRGLGLSRTDCAGV